MDCTLPLAKKLINCNIYFYYRMEAPNLMVKRKYFCKDQQRQNVNHYALEIAGSKKEIENDSMNSPTI